MGMRNLITIDCSNPILQEPNLNCFIHRVASHPERLQYIYFDTILLLRAVARLGPYLSAFDYCSSGNHENDVETHLALARLSTLQNTQGLSTSLSYSEEKMQTF